MNDEDTRPPVSTPPAPASTPARTDAQEACELRNRALAEARLAVQEHLRRAEELKRTAVSTARELLQKEPLAGALLASLEQGVLGAPSQMPAVGLDPLSAIDNLLSERQRSLDETLQRFMRAVGARGPTHVTEPNAGTP